MWNAGIVVIGNTITDKASLAYVCIRLAMRQSRQPLCQLTIRKHYELGWNIYVKFHSRTDEEYGIIIIIIKQRQLVIQKHYLSVWNLTQNITCPLTKQGIRP